jgi:hypothetical protein
MRKNVNLKYMYILFGACLLLIYFLTVLRSQNPQCLAVLFKIDR